MTVADSGGLGVVCRTRGHSCEAAVSALDERGCLIETGNGFLSDGDRATLRFGCGMRVVGRVRPLSARFARIEFEAALHPAVLAHLSPPSAPVRHARGRRRI
ncbi:hypothetical protein [Croceibacterium aestuarii]|uniref:hypothetical protein n=1 Tax=Croceibacterium aestuarii TaxID=3064139 RepID=UPI00272EC5AC|nr:hypothetical protein [Croceibacterium sp. D39]